MKKFLHVLNTWLVSILILLLGYFIYDQFTYNTGDFDEWFNDPELFLVLFYAMIITVPSFFISWVFLSIIQKTCYSNYEKLFLWFMAVIIATVLNILIVALIFYDELPPVDIFFFFWPAYVAAVISILIRLKQFFSLINKATSHETNMV